MTSDGSAERAQQVEKALVEGDWITARELAVAWRAFVTTEGTRDIRPAFVLNAIHLLHGEMDAARTLHEEILQDQADIDVAKSWLAALRQRHEKNGFLHLLTGLLLAQSGQSEESMDSFKQAIVLLPTAPYPHFFLGQMYERADRADMALKAYRDAVRLDPTFISGRTALGLLYQAQGQLEMALPQFREILKLRPEDSVAHGMLASALATQGKFEPALKEYKEAVRLDPRNAELRYGLGKFYHDRGRLELAMHEYREAVAIDPNYSPAHAEIGWMLLDQRGNMINSMEAFNRALRSDERNARAYLGIAKLYASRGKREAAWQNYQKALNLEKDPQIRNNILTELFMEGGSWDV